MVVLNTRNYYMLHINKFNTGKKKMKKKNKITSNFTLHLHKGISGDILIHMVSTKYHFNTGSVWAKRIDPTRHVFPWTDTFWSELLKF